jgi:hypothetical protein
MQRDLEDQFKVEIDRIQLGHISKAIERLSPTRLFFVEEFNDRLELLLIKNTSISVNHEANVMMENEVRWKFGFHRTWITTTLWRL